MSQLATTKLLVSQRGHIREKSTRKRSAGVANVHCNPAKKIEDRILSGSIPCDHITSDGLLSITGQDHQHAPYMVQQQSEHCKVCERVEKNESKKRQKCSDDDMQPIDNNDAECHSEEDKSVNKSGILSVTEQGLCDYRQGLEQQDTNEELNQTCDSNIQTLDQLVDSDALKKRQDMEMQTSEMQTSDKACKFQAVTLKQITCVESVVANGMQYFDPKLTPSDCLYQETIGEMSQTSDQPGLSETQEILETSNERRESKTKVSKPVHDTKTSSDTIETLRSAGFVDDDGQHWKSLTNEDKEKYRQWTMDW